MPDVITVIEDFFLLMVVAFASPQGLKLMEDIRQLMNGKAVQPLPPQSRFAADDTQPLPPLEQARAAAQQAWQATAVNPPAPAAQSKWSAG